MREIWRDTLEFDGSYQVSNLGRIKSKDRFVTKRHISGKKMKQFYKGKILKGAPQKHGHIAVHLGFKNKKYLRLLHRLILEAFIGKAPIGYEACHNNGIPDDNRIENLRWDTHAENNADRKKHGMYAVGEKHVMSKLTEKQAKHIKQSRESAAFLAEKYDVYITTIYKIKAGQTWVHL